MNEDFPGLVICASGILIVFSDELLYNARIHPEQYSNTLSDDQITQLHKSLHYVCDLAVETLADSSKFPKEWLFKHRWQKGKKDATMKLADGTKFVYLTVGGRTSAVVPSVQKKTGPVAKDVDEDRVEASGMKGGTKRKATTKDEPESDAELADTKPVPKKGGSRKAAATQEDKTKEKLNGASHEEERRPNDNKPLSKKIKNDPKPETNGTVTKPDKTKKTKSAATKVESEGRRRSGRVSGKESSYAED